MLLGLFHSSLTQPVPQVTQNNYKVITVKIISRLSDYRIIIFLDRI